MVFLISNQSQRTKLPQFGTNRFVALVLRLTILEVLQMLQFVLLEQKREHETNVIQFNPLFFLVRLDLLQPIQLQFSELKVADSI